MPTPTISGSGFPPRRLVAPGAGSLGAVPSRAPGGLIGRAGAVGNSQAGPGGVDGTAGTVAAAGVCASGAGAAEVGSAGRGVAGCGVMAGSDAGPGRADAVVTRPAAGRRSPHEMQNVRPVGFARPQTGQVGPDGASDGATAGVATGGADGGVPAAGGAATAGGAGAIGSPAEAGVEAPSWGSAAAVAGVPASSAAYSRNAPQLPQKASPAAFCVPHFAQIILLAFASLGLPLGAA